VLFAMATTPALASQFWVSAIAVAIALLAAWLRTRRRRAAP
jgi:hypothetical protein